MEPLPTIPSPDPEIDLFQKLFLVMDDGMAIHRMIRDTDGRVVDTEIVAVNPAWRRIMGFEPQAQVTGTHLSILELVTPISGRSLFDLYNQAANTGAHVSEEVLLAPEQRYFWLILTPLASEYVAAVYHEITLLKQAESARQSIIDAVSDAVFVYLAESGLLVDLNRRAVELAGYPREMLLGKATVPGEPAEFTRARADFLHRALAGEAEMQLLTPVATQEGEKWYDLRARCEARPGQTILLVLIHDVTEMQRQMQALSASEARYRAVSESISDYAYSLSVDADSICTMDWITDAWTTITGCSEADAQQQVKEDVQGFYSRYIYADDLATVLNNWWLMPDKSLVEYEFRLKTHNGGVRWMRAYNRAVPLPGTQGYRIIGAARDISDRVQAEGMYLSIFNAVNDSIFVHDIETARIVDLNIQAALLMGYPRDEIIDRLRMPHETYEAARHRASLIRRAAQGDIFEDESSYIGPDGQAHWVESHFKVGMVGGKRRVVCVARDVTERKQAFEALERSEARNRAISEMITDFALRIDIKDNARLSLDWITDAYTRLTGYTGADLQAAFEQEDDLPTMARRFVHEDDIWKLSRDLWSKRNEQQVVCEFRLMRKNRTSLWVRGYFKPIIEGKRMVAFSGAFQDITGLMQAELNYRALFEASLDAILILDARDGNVVDANQKGDALLIDSWSGNPEKIQVDSIFRGVTREAFLALLHQAAEGHTVEQVWEVKHSPRRLAVRYEVRMRPVAIGDERRVLAVLRDVSDYPPHQPLQVYQAQ